MDLIYSIIMIMDKLFDLGFFILAYWYAYKFLFKDKHNYRYGIMAILFRVLSM